MSLRQVDEMLERLATVVEGPRTFKTDYPMFDAVKAHPELAQSLANLLNAKIRYEGARHADARFNVKIYGDAEADAKPTAADAERAYGKAWRDAQAVARKYDVLEKLNQFFRDALGGKVPRTGKYSIANGKIVYQPE